MDANGRSQERIRIAELEKALQKAEDLIAKLKINGWLSAAEGIDVTREEINDTLSAIDAAKRAT